MEDGELPAGRHPRLTTAMVLAAGYGTRLRPLTDAMPKCMIPVAGKPILEHTIDRLRRYGISELIINVCHQPETIINYFGDGRRWGVGIRYSVESQPLGTAGGVKKVASLFGGPFLVMYGDNLTTCRFDRLYALHRDRDGMVTIGLYHREDPTASGIVALDEDDRIVRFLEKPAADQVFSHWVNAGVFVAEPALLDFIPTEGSPDFGRDIFPSMLARGQALYGYRMGADERLWWIDTIEDLRRVRALEMAHGLQI